MGQVSRVHSSLDMVVEWFLWFGDGRLGEGPLLDEVQVSRKGLQGDGRKTYKRSWFRGTKGSHKALVDRLIISAWFLELR
jgi:hypothetical protein